MAFNIGNEIVYRRVAAAAAAPDGVAWAMISLCARNSPAADDQESLIDYQEICQRIGSVMIDNEPGAAPAVDDAWVTKSPKPPVLTDFPDISDPKELKANHAT